MVMLPNTSVTSDPPRQRPETPSGEGAVPPTPDGPGWMARVRRALVGGHRSRADDPPRPGGDAPRGSCPSGGAPGVAGPGGGGAGSMPQPLRGDARCVFVLLEGAADVMEERGAPPAWKAIDGQMALIPGGVVPVLESSGNVVPTELSGYYLD